MHIRAVIETNRNDGIRKIFMGLLDKELNIYDDLLKIGKVKGWMKVPPMYDAGI
jgi:hypothetical protein